MLSPDQKILDFYKAHPDIKERLEKSIYPELVEAFLDLQERLAEVETHLTLNAMIESLKFRMRIEDNLRAAEDIETTGKDDMKAAALFVKSFQEGWKAQNRARNYWLRVATSEFYNNFAEAVGPKYISWIDSLFVYLATRAVEEVKAIEEKRKSKKR